MTDLPPDHEADLLVRLADAISEWEGHPICGVLSGPLRSNAHVIICSLPPHTEGAHAWEA